MPSSSVDVLGRAGGVEPLAQARVPGVGQVREARTELVGVRADERAAPGQVDVIAHDHQRPRPERRVEAAGGVGQDHDPRAELPEQQDRLDDEPGVVALVQVEAALEHDHRPPGEPAEEQPSGVPRRGRRRPAGQLRERDRDGILEVVGQPAEPGAEHDPDLGHEVGAGAHRGHQGGQTRRLVDGRDRARRVDRGRAGHRGLHYASRVDGRGRWLRPARRKYRHRDADHVPSGSGRPGDRGETAAWRGNEAPEATGGGAKRPLM